MKPIEEKDRPKVMAMIGGGVVVLAVIGYEVFTMMAPPPPPPAAAAKPADDKKATTKATLDEDPGEKQRAQQMELALQNVPSSGGRDPFMPSGSAAPSGKKVATTAPPPPKPVAVQLPPTPSPTMAGKLSELLGLGEAKATVRPVSNNVAPVVPPIPPPPQVTVTGVVRSDGTNENIAIIRGGQTKGDDRRYLTVGDEVGNGYRIVAVYADGIDIVDKTGKRRATIRIGKSGEDTRATK